MPLPSSIKKVKVLDFSTKLAVKLRSQRPVYVAATSDTTSSSGVSPKESVKQKANTVICQYCNKTGHTIRYFKKTS